MPRVKRHFRWMSLLLAFLLGGCWEYVSSEARQRFEARSGRATVTVYAVDVVRGQAVEHDLRLAQQLAAFLRDEGLADSVVARGSLEVPVRWDHNQAAMARESALAYAAKVKAADIGTDYALYAQILCDPRETQVLGVHFYLAEKSGLVAAGGLTNSHWEEFKAVQPRDRDGGYDVLTRLIRKRWKRA